MDRQAQRGADVIVIRRARTTRVLCVIAFLGACWAEIGYYRTEDLRDAGMILGASFGLLIVYVGLKPMWRQISAAEEWTTWHGQSQDAVKGQAKLLLSFGPTFIFAFICSESLTPASMHVLSIVSAVLSPALFLFERGLRIEMDAKGIRRIQSFPVRASRTIPWEAADPLRPNRLWIIFKVWGKPGSFAFDTTNYRVSPAAASMLVGRVFRA